MWGKPQSEVQVDKSFLKYQAPEIVYIYKKNV